MGWWRQAALCDGTPRGRRFGALNRRTVRGAFRSRCRTPRRERSTGTGPAAGIAARPGVRRRAHRPGRGPGSNSWRVQRRRRGGAGRAQRRVTTGPTGQENVPPHHPQLGSRLTVAAWQTLVLSVMGLVVLAGAATGAVLLIRTDAVTRELTDDIQPARVSAYRLQSALRDQETSLRGYVIAADPQFLVPYDDGQRAEQDASEDITARLSDRVDLITDLIAIESAGAAWRSTYAQPLISGVIPGAPNVVNTDTADRGKAEFDHIRALL